MSILLTEVLLTTSRTFDGECFVALQTTVVLNALASASIPFISLVAVSRYFLCQHE
jgi:hypothetical protein